MYYAVVVAILYCVAPSECYDEHDSLKHALQTVLTLGKEAAQPDLQTINYIRKIVDKIKAAVDHSKTTQQAKRDDEERPMKFSDFLKKSIVIVTKLDDQELENLLSVINEEGRKYHYKGCKFYELMESPALRRSITKAFNDLQTIPLSAVRKTLSNIYNKLTGGNLTHVEKDTINFVNFLYDKRHIDKMKDTLRSLSSYQQNSNSHTRKSLSSLIREGLRTLIFDHYSDIPDVGRTFLKQQINNFYDLTKTTKTHKMSDGTDEEFNKEFKSISAATKKHKYGHNKKDKKNDIASDKSMEKSKNINRGRTSDGEKSKLDSDISKEMKKKKRFNSDKSAEIKVIFARGQSKPKKSKADKTEDESDEDVKGDKSNEKEKEEQTERAEKDEEQTERAEKEEEPTEKAEKEEEQTEKAEIEEQTEKVEKEEEQTEKAETDKGEIPLHFISLFPEEKKTKSTTPRKASITKKHAKILKSKSAMKQETEPSSTEQKGEDVNWTKMVLSDKDEENSKKRKEIWSSSFSREIDMEKSKTTPKTTTKKLPKKVATKKKPSNIFELWSFPTTKNNVRAAPKKHDIFDISISSSSEKRMERAKLTKTTKRPVIKRIRPHSTEVETKNKLQKKPKGKNRTKYSIFGFSLSESSSAERTFFDSTSKKTDKITKPAKKLSARIHPQHTGEEDDERQSKKQKKTSTTRNFLLDFGVSLFQAALAVKDDDGTTKPSSTSTSKKILKKRPVNLYAYDKDDDFSNLSANNKFWVGTSKRTHKDGILRHKPVQKVIHSKSKTKQNVDVGKDIGFFRKLRKSKPNREGLFERSGFIQSLVKPPLAHRTTTRVTKDERRGYWASAPPLIQGVQPRALRASEESDSSGTYSDSDDGHRDREDREDQGLSIEAYTPFFRRQLNPLEGEYPQNNTHNLTIANVETVFKNTIESSHDPQLKEQLQNLEQLVKDLKNKFDNETSSTTLLKSIQSNRERAFLDKGTLNKFNNVDKMLDKDETESSSAESSAQYDRAESHKRKYESEESTTIVSRTTATRPRQKVYTTTTTRSTNVIQSRELFDKPKMNFKNETSRIIKPEVRLADSSHEISNFILKENATENKSKRFVVNKHSAAKICTCGPNCACKDGCHKCSHNNNDTDKHAARKGLTTVKNGYRKKRSVQQSYWAIINY